MSADRICSRLAVLFVGMTVAAVASANWQASSTDQRLLMLFNGEPVPLRLERAGIQEGATVDMGARCSVVFNAGHAMLPGHPEMFQLPRGTLEMFVDHDTVLYRTQHPDSSVSAAFAPVIQFHRLVPRALTRMEEDTEMDGDPMPNPIGWSPGSIYDDDRDDTTIPGPPIVTYTPNNMANYLLRSQYMQHSGATYLVLPPTDPSGIEVSSANPYDAQIDEADLESSYWLDYPDEVYQTLRTSTGQVSLRVYFPGHTRNGRTAMSPEQPHYVNWTLDLGMTDAMSDANEVFAKLEACAGPEDMGGLDIDGSHVPTALE
ncbi:MAG: hypothetical protein OXC69_00600 [Candidatus Tectomicrobia bacterium]|nr:hypothetical protein [Candidatus Tectomicrobia bacterium]